MDPRTLAALPLAELRRLAAARHLKGRSRMKREDLVAVLSVREPSDPTASRPAAKKAPRVAAKKAPRVAAKKAPRPAAKKAPRPAAKKAPRPAAKKAPRPAVEALDRPVETPVVAARPPREVAIRTLDTRAPPREPSEGDVFIDRGAVLPDRYPGTRVRVMVRDPGTLFVYWEIPPEAGGEAWEIASLDADDQTLQAFRVGHEGASGYLNVASASVERVTLRPVQQGLATEPWATVDLGSSLPEPPLADGPAPWVEVPVAFPDRDPPAWKARSVPSDVPAAPKASQRRVAEPQSGDIDAPGHGHRSKPLEAPDATSSTLPAVRRRT